MEKNNKNTTKANIKPKIPIDVNKIRRFREYYAYKDYKIKGDV